MFTLTTAASTSPWQLSKYFFRSYKAKYSSWVSYNMCRAVSTFLAACYTELHICNNLVALWIEIMSQQHIQQGSLETSRIFQQHSAIKHWLWPLMTAVMCITYVLVYSHKFKTLVNKSTVVFRGLDHKMKS